MGATIRIAGLTLIAGFAFGLVAHAADPPVAVAGGAMEPQVLKADQLTKRQFEQQLKGLPDDAVIEFRGQRMTKAQIRASGHQKAQAMQANIQAAANQARANFERRRALIEQLEQAKLQADNATAMTEFTRLVQALSEDQTRQIEAIQEEARQLVERSRTASPAEQAQIEERAGQLLEQLEQLGW